jgi:acyl carrier protein
VTRQQFLEQLGEVIETEVPVIGVETLKDLKWDSLAAISFIALADEACGVKVAPKDIAGCNTVNELVALVSAGFEKTADPERP